MTKEQLIGKLVNLIYPTSDIVYNRITPEEYILGIAQFFVDEIFDRRIDVSKALPLFAELGVILHKESTHRP